MENKAHRLYIMNDAKSSERLDESRGKNGGV